MCHRIDRLVSFFAVFLALFLLSGCKPSAQNQSITTESGVPVAITLLATNAPSSFAIVSSPKSGLLSGSDSLYVYTPNMSFAGEDYFTFTASNKDGTSNVATVTISVTPRESLDPSITFNTDKKIVKPNQSFEISWSVTNASSVQINELGSVNPIGTHTTAINRDTTFTISATGVGGTSTKRLTVYVDNLSLSIKTPTEGAAIDTNIVSVSGEFTGPETSVVTVNGKQALIDGAKFVASNISLAPGQNTITAHLSSPQNLVFEKSVNVLATLNSPELVAVYEKAEGLAPFSAELEMAYLGQYKIKQFSVDFESDGHVDYVGQDTHVLKTFSSTGMFVTTIVAEDVQGNFYRTDLPIVVLDKGKLENSINATFGSYNEAMSSGSLSEALQYFHPRVRSRYQETLSSVISKAPAIESSLSSLRLVSMTGDFAELEGTRRINGKNYIYLIYFAKDEDGIWRIYSV